MKDENIKKENGLSDGSVDFMLKAYAAQSKGQYGSDEDMFASLREDYEREKAGKAEKRRAARSARLRKLLIPIGTAAAVLVVLSAVLIPFLLKDNTPEYEMLDGLYVIPVTETQLKSELGFSPVIPRPEGYTIDTFNVYKNEDGEIKAYSFHYSTDMDVDTRKIEIFCVINNDFIFEMEKIIDKEGKNQIIAFRAARLYIDNKDESRCRLAIKNDKYIITLNMHDSDLLSWVITQVSN